MNLQAISELAELADYSFAFALRAAASIGVADHIGDQPTHISELATRSGCHPHGLLRLLRALGTKSVFTEVEPETFALTPIGELLQTDHPLSMRWFFRLEPDVQALTGLEYSVRTGEPSFDKHFGAEYFDWLSQNDAVRDRFRQSQKALNRLELLAITRSYPWAKISSMVDVGGNDGSLLSNLLKLHPALRGKVFDLPDTVAAAHRTFEDFGVAERAEAVAGDVLSGGGVPEGADLYSIKRVLVGFSDDQAVTALSAIRDAMRADSRILIMEPMRGASDQVGYSLDLLMLVLGLGKVRTPEEFEDLLVRAGLTPQRRIGAGLITIVEGRKEG
jgi:hypothetical protein